MKKLLLTISTAALFSIAAMAQEQEQDTIPSNQFREFEAPVPDPAEEPIDSTSTDFRQEPGLQLEPSPQPDPSLRQDPNIQQDPGLQQDPNIEQTPDIEQAPALQQDPNIDQQTDSTLNEVNEGIESTVEDPNPQGRVNYMAVPEVEVMEGKEGPHSEVVYQYQGELFYIDREEKKIVKAEESALQDAKHEVIINEGDDNPDNQ